MWPLSQLQPAGFCINVRSKELVSLVTLFKLVQHLVTSSLIGLSQARPRARSSGLATSTRPGVLGGVLGANSPKSDDFVAI